MPLSHSQARASTSVLLNPISTTQTHQGRRAAAGGRNRSHLTNKAKLAQKQNVTNWLAKAK